MSGIVNKVKEVLHKDKDNTHDPTHSTHDTTTGHHTAGHGTTGGATGYDTTTGGVGHNTTSGGLTGNDPTGPHGSHLGNKADPRVDSDRYGTAGNTAGAGGYGTGQYGEHTGHSTTGHSTTGHGTTGRSDPTGPHDSKVANKLDPRVDSDQYGTAGNTAGAGGHGTGQYGSTTGHSTTGHHTTGQAGGLTGALAGQQYASDGPHNTHTANVLDPHVGGGAGTGQYGAGHNTTGGIGSTGRSDPTGPHDSHLGNKADPRVDSDRYGAAGTTSGAGGVGAGQYTEGHHGTHGTHGTTGHNTTGGVGGTSGEYGSTGGSTTLKEGELPKALTEDRSKAVPHSKLPEKNEHGHDHKHGEHADQETAGHHNTNTKPSLMDKLNPKKDTDGDGKAGIMD